MLLIVVWLFAPLWSHTYAVYAPSLAYHCIRVTSSEYLVTLLCPSVAVCFKNICIPSPHLLRGPLGDIFDRDVHSFNGIRLSYPIAFPTG